MKVLDAAVRLCGLFKGWCESSEKKIVILEVDSLLFRNTGQCVEDWETSGIEPEGTV